MGTKQHNTQSLETILTYENKNASQWSTVWSTSNVPGMDTAMGVSGGARAASGRRRLRTRALALGGLLTMHCRITAAAITGGYFVFIMFLILAVVLLANPLRHFEVYLGQWSISGPGRAFRIIPMFDGIGLAVCLNAIIRAIMCCTMASIAATYVLHSVSDARLPFTYCRDFNYKHYEPIKQDILKLRSMRFPWNLDNSLFLSGAEFTTMHPATVGLRDGAWRNITFKSKRLNRPKQIDVCKETYATGFPPPFNTPPYNFFYVEVVQFRPDLSLTNFNITLLIIIVVAWVIIWAIMIGERISHGRLVWNNTYSWFVVIPWAWAAVMALTAILNVKSLKKILHKAFRLDSMDMVAAIADALEVALYIHSASTGTEIIHGKGLNHYATGHIDPNLNAENVWFSGIMLLLAVLNCISTAVCALTDFMQIRLQEAHLLHSGSMWIIPMYSNCTANGTHSHLLSSLVFAGLTFSYMSVAYTLIKTALHTIFEYKVRLVFIEQLVVGLLILVCMGLSVFFATNGGIALLESVDAVMTGVAMPLVCLMELVVMLWVYRSRDFISDMNVATEDNACSARIGTQWQIIPFVIMITLGMKIAVLVRGEIPVRFLYGAMLPLGAVIIAVPIRACFNALLYFKPAAQTRP